MNSSQTTTATRSFTPEVPSGRVGVSIPGTKREKLTPRIAAGRAGVSVWTIYRLLQADLIQGERPSEKKILIYADSLDAHLVATRDPEFWETHHSA